MTASLCRLSQTHLDTEMPPGGGYIINANSAVLRSTWAAHPFDEDLTGLEDMELAKRLVAAGHRIAYVAEAPVFHHHKEDWPQVRRRFEREAIALRSIMPEVHLSRLDVLRCVLDSARGDWRSARRNGITSTSKLDMLRYRWNQYVGSFVGNHEHRLLSRQAKQKYFFPETSRKTDQDEWLKPVRRPSAHEG